MESTRPPTAEETALGILRDWLNVSMEPNRSLPDKLTLHVHGPADEKFRAQATKLLGEAGYESAEFREEEFKDAHGNKHTLTYLEGHKAHCVRNRKTA